MIALRRMDELGRFVLPVDVRRALDLAPGDLVEVHQDGDEVVLRKHKPGCAICGSQDGHLAVRGKMVCRTCAEEVAAACKVSA